MNTKQAPPPPPAAAERDGDWDDSKLLHYSQKLPDGKVEVKAICGFEPESGMANATPQQMKELPYCPICVSLAKYDGRWKLY